MNKFKVVAFITKYDANVADTVMPGGAGKYDDIAGFGVFQPDLFANIDKLRRRSGYAEIEVFKYIAHKARAIKALQRIGHGRAVTNADQCTCKLDNTIARNAVSV